MSANRDDTLKQFCDVTGADEARSKFFLESSNWQLEIALSSFYEHGGNMDEQAPEPPQSEPIPIDSSSDTDSPPSPVKRKEKNKRPNRDPRSGVATLSSLQQNDDSSSDEEHGEAFYAGGSERSGQQILDPTKRRDIVSEMFKSVREQGAVSFEDDPGTGGRQAGAFSGVGYRLGQTPDDHVPVIQPFRQGSDVRSVRLRLYREGFTVDDGPIRDYMNPTHSAFLSCIRRGEIPPELSVNGAEVRVALEDRRNEEGPRHTCMKAAFSGKGHMLGSPTPVTVGAPPPTVPAEVVIPEETSNIQAAEQAVPVNQDLPATTLQIRLADGTRLTGRFNHTHTVGDIRRYITTAVPASPQTFVLMTTFPSTELADPEVTLEQAKLLNSVVVQRIK